MKRRTIALSTILTIGAAGAAIGLTAARGAGDDEIVMLAQCPVPVQVTIQAHLAGGALREIERTTDHGEVLFEVDVNTGAGILEFDVAEDGAYRGPDLDGEDPDDPEDLEDEEGPGPDEDGDVRVTLEECPAPVQATIARHVAGGSVNEIERSPAGNFEVDASGPEGRFEFVVSGDGTYLGPEGDGEDPL